MNTETGRIYTGEQEISDARARGEPIAEVSAQVAALMELGQIVVEKEARRRAWRERWGTAIPTPAAQEQAR